MQNLLDNLKKYLCVDNFRVANKIQSYPVFRENILYDKCLIVYLECYYYNNKVLDFIFLNFSHLYRLKDFDNLKDNTILNVSKLEQNDINKLNIGVNFDYTNDVLFTENFEFISTMDDEGSFVMYFSPKLKNKFMEYINMNKLVDYSSNLYFVEYLNEYTKFLYKHYHYYLFL